MINSVHYKFKVPFYEVNANGAKTMFSKQVYEGQMYVYTDVDPFLLPDLLVEKHDLDLKVEIEDLEFSVQKL